MYSNFQTHVSSIRSMENDKQGRTRTRQFYDFFDIYLTLKKFEVLGRLKSLV